ncbi:MAG: nucleotidyltransferase domain-containing protein [Phycisphaerae bacterium]|nr:nucleotidyltransferase domain-containing protein [Phycisphaerae bacterium]
MVSEGTIKLMVQRIVERFHPLRVILFGSEVRGEATFDSDVDLLVVLPQVENKREAAIAIRRVFSDLTTPIDIVVTCPDEIRDRGDMIGSVLRPALREGRTLYEQTQSAG